ncbi:MAG: DapH/DapD/GlmU-related protein [Eubacteriales bacterium]
MDWTKKREELLANGVIMMDADTVYVEDSVVVGKGTLLLPNTILRGETVIGEDCEIGPSTMLVSCKVGNGVTINSSQCNESTIEDGTKIGPFAYLRPNSHLGKNVKVGDFVEVKNSTIGDGTKISHLTYVGDSDVGSAVNFGCGTVTVNYDGINKARCTIEDNAFLGCNTNLIAPVTVEKGAYTAAGSTITKNVSENALAVARARQKELPQWAEKHRKLKESKGKS